MAPSELASFTLFPATPAQVIESRKRTWPQWGNTLTEEQYLERYAKMDVMEHAVDSKLITWVLAPRDNPGTIDFMCSCETYKRQGLVRYSGSKEIKEVTCYGVACVFTPPHKRGRGYASHMMRLLHWVTSGRTSEYNLPEFPEDWGAPPPEVKEAGNAVFCILYSDVGENFYGQAGPGLEDEGGWKVRGAISSIWEIAQQPEVKHNGTASEWTWIEYEDLDTLWKKDAQLIRRLMEALPDSSPDYHTVSPRAFVSCLPDNGVGSFNVFNSTFATRNIVAMDIWGVEKKSGNMDQPTYATWSIDINPSPPTLIVTQICASEADFPELLGKIQEVARMSGVTRMEIWNIHKHLLKVAAETGGYTFERREHLPSIKWYGEGKTKDIEWVFNEKFCWC